MFRRQRENLSEATLTALSRSLAIIEFNLDGTIAKFYEKWFSKKPGPDDLAVVITPGYGVPGMPGYDPTPHELKCN